MTGDNSKWIYINKWSILQILRSEYDSEHAETVWSDKKNMALLGRSSKT